MTDWMQPIFAPWDGNASALARDISEQVVKVNQWRARGRIPDAYRETIIAAARDRGTVLSHRDFIHPDNRLAELAIG